MSDSDLTLAKIELEIKKAEIAAHTEIEAREKSNQRLGLVIGGVVAVAGLLIAYKLIVVGQYLLGSVIVGIDIGILFSTFAYGHKLADRRVGEIRTISRPMQEMKQLPASGMTVTLGEPMNSFERMRTTGVLSLDVDEAFDELTTVIHEHHQAVQVATAAGFPPSRLPNTTTTLDFWTKIATEARNGALPGGIRPLLREAAKLYPANSIFARYHSPSNYAQQDRNGKTGTDALFSDASLTRLVE